MNYICCLSMSFDVSIIKICSEISVFHSPKVTTLFTPRYIFVIQKHSLIAFSNVFVVSKKSFAKPQTNIEISKQKRQWWYLWWPRRVNHFEYFSNSKLCFNFAMVCQTLKHIFAHHQVFYNHPLLILFTSFINIFKNNTKISD